MLITLTTSIVLIGRDRELGTRFKQYFARTAKLIKLMNTSRII